MPVTRHYWVRDLFADGRVIVWDHFPFDCGVHRRTEKVNPTTNMEFLEAEVSIGRGYAHEQFILLSKIGRDWVDALTDIRPTISLDGIHLAGFEPADDLLYLAMVLA